MDQRLSLVTLGVRDLDRSRGFYEAMGWRASKFGEGQGVVFFQLGGLVLSLFGRSDLAKDAGLAEGGGEGFGGIALAQNVGTKVEVDAVLSQAAAAGGRILRPAAEAFWGGYSGYFADPDGHPWEVAWNPGIPLQPDGTLRLP